MMNLIIVDDEATIRWGLKTLIESFGLELCVAGVASDAQEAMVLAERCHPELLLVDINIPGASGLDFVEELHSKHPDGKVIILTGYDKFDYAQRALRLGVYDYLLKPVNRALLYKSLLGAMTAYKHRSRELDVLKSAPKPSLNTHGDFVEDALCSIQTRYSEPGLCLNIIADELHISAPALSRAIKKKTGKSFSDYLTGIRMERAIAMLSDSSELIYNIAESIGYSSQHYFARIFKEYTGVSPSEYRKNM